MQETELQADVVSGVTDPITGAPTNVTYPQPISSDIDLLDRKPCQGGICETYLIKDRSNEAPTNNTTPTGPGAPPTNASPAPIVSPPPNAGPAQQCCNQMPPQQPCLALACPPPAPTPPCNPSCPPPGGQPVSSDLYRRGGIYFENHGNN